MTLARPRIYWNLIWHVLTLYFRLRFCRARLLEKGLLSSNSPKCTLSQNGYGDGWTVLFDYHFRLAGDVFEQGRRGHLNFGQWHPWSSGYDVSLTR